MNVCSHSIQSGSLEEMDQIIRFFKRILWNDSKKNIQCNPISIATLLIHDLIYLRSLVNWLWPECRYLIRIKAECVYHMLAFTALFRCTAFIFAFETILQNDHHVHFLPCNLHLAIYIGSKALRLFYARVCVCRGNAIWNYFQPANRSLYEIYVYKCSFYGRANGSMARLWSTIWVIQKTIRCTILFRCGFFTHLHSFLFFIFYFYCWLFNSYNII